MSKPSTSPSPRAASMRDLRAALPQFFAANVPALVRALSDKGARVESLTLALVGGAIERAQSGNLPAVWLDVRAAGEALKGATKARAAKALGIVDEVRPGSVKGTVDDFAAFAEALRARVAEALTPPAPKEKPATERVDWRARAEAAEAEAAALRAEAEVLRAEVAALREAAALRAEGAEA